MATKEAKAFMFFNCDEDKSTESMNATYNNEVFKDTKASRKALWAKVAEEAAEGRVQLEDEKAAKEAVTAGDPTEAGKFLRYGTVVEVVIR